MSEKIEAVELAIDEYLHDLRETMFEGWAKGVDDIEFAAALIRTAYAKGLMDALTNPVEMRKFIRDYGYKIPSVGEKL